MKRLLWVLGILISQTLYGQQDIKILNTNFWYQVSIGKNNPNFTDPNAHLEIGTLNSHKASLYLAPTLNTNISNPKQGFIFVSSLNGHVYAYNGFSWDDLTLTGILTEADPIFGASVAAGITSTNLLNWNAAYNGKINSLAVTGTDTKTITLTTQDGSTISGNFTDQGITTEVDPTAIKDNPTTTAQNAQYYVSKPSKIEYLSDTTGNTPGALEVYRTIQNPDAKAPQNIRSVFKLYSTEAGHNDKEFTSIYGGLHITADNTQDYTSGTEGIIGIAATATNFGSGNIKFMSGIASYGGYSGTATGNIDRFAFFKATNYSTNNNPNKYLTKWLGGYMMPKLNRGQNNIHLGLGIGTIDSTTTLYMGMINWPMGNWGIYDKTGYDNYLGSGTVMINDTLNNGTGAKLQVNGRVSGQNAISTNELVTLGQLNGQLADSSALYVKLLGRPGGQTVLGGLSGAEELTFKSTSASVTPVGIDSNGIHIGGAGLSGTMFRTSKTFFDPTANVNGIRNEPSISARGADNGRGVIASQNIVTVAASNTKNWTSTITGGNSVLQTSSGATGKANWMIGHTISANLSATGFTTDTLTYLRIYKTGSGVINNTTYIQVGIGTYLAGNWAYYNASGFTNYMGTGYTLVGSSTNDNTGSLLQVNGRTSGLRAISATQYVTKGQLDSLAGSGGITETDPIYSASPAAGITSGLIANWNAAYNDKINSAAFSGTSTKTLTLTQQDGGTVTANFTDQGITSETDPVFGASVAAGITSTNTSNWTAGYNDKINSLAVTGTGTKTITLTQQDGGTVTGNFTDQGITSETDPIVSARTLTLTAGSGISITGGTQDLSANRTWTISATAATQNVIPIVSSFASASNTSTNAYDELYSYTNGTDPIPNVGEKLYFSFSGSLASSSGYKSAKIIVNGNDVLANLGVGTSASGGSWILDGYITRYATSGTNQLLVNAKITYSGDSENLTRAQVSQVPPNISGTFTLKLSAISGSASQITVLHEMIEWHK